MDHRLRIGLGFELMALGRQFLAQFLKVFDDAVMDQHATVVGMGMGVGFVGQAVGRPSRMADTHGAADGAARDQIFKIGDLAFGAAALDAAIDQRRDTRRIIATVFEPLQPVDQQWRDVVLADDTDNATHGPNSPFLLSWMPCRLFPPACAAGTALPSRHGRSGATG